MWLGDALVVALVAKILLEASHNVSMEVKDACADVFVTSYSSVAIIGSKEL